MTFHFGGRTIRRFLAASALAAVVFSGSTARAQYTPPAPAAGYTSILFVGNSYTHGRYAPVLNYNGGDAADPSMGVVHDLLCGGTTTGACAAVPASGPLSTLTPENGTNTLTKANEGAIPSNGNGLQGQLAYLNTHASAQYNDATGPYGGVAGIFLQMSKAAGLKYDVNLVTVSSATLGGYATGAEDKADLAQIKAANAGVVVLQDQTFEPLPTSITVNGSPVTTRGNPTNFNKGVDNLVTDLATNTSTGTSKNTNFVLYETPPLAAYGYTSSNPAQPIFGSSTVAAQGGNTAYAPYIGDANPIAAMASDLHNGYAAAAANADANTHLTNSVGVAYAGDAWVTAINQGIGEQDPFLANEPPGEVDLWDSDPLLACCTTPVGYHPSIYGDYLDALTIFYTVTGINPETLSSEFNPLDPNYASSASDTLGISPELAYELAVAAVETQNNSGPVPEPASMTVLGFGLLVLGRLRKRRLA